MATSTKPKHRATTGGGRFARSGTPAGSHRFGRPATTAGTRSMPRAGMMRRRQQPQKSTAQKALGALTGMLPTGSAKKAVPRGGKAKGAGGLAVLAGVAGLAMKNRDKLPGPLGRSHGESANREAIKPAETPTTPPPTAPTV